MNYKKSIYNVEINKLDNEDVLLYNAYGKVDLKTLSIYSDIENVSVDSIPDEDDLKNIGTMIRRGFIVHNEKDELSTVKIAICVVHIDTNFQF